MKEGGFTLVQHRKNNNRNKRTHKSRQHTQTASLVRESRRQVAMYHQQTKITGFRYSRQRSDVSTQRIEQIMMDIRKSVEQYR